MTCLPPERIIGIETFYTTHEGIGGKLRRLPEDFTVTELSCYPSQHDNGVYTIAEVTAKNWETNLLIRAVAKQLHISRR